MTERDWNFTLGSRGVLRATHRDPAHENSSAKPSGQVFVFIRSGREIFLKNVRTLLYLSYEARQRHAAQASLDFDNVAHLAYVLQIAPCLRTIHTFFLEIVANLGSKDRRQYQGSPFLDKYCPVWTTPARILRRCLRRSNRRLQCNQQRLQCNQQRLPLHCTPAEWHRNARRRESSTDQS